MQYEIVPQEHETEKKKKQLPLTAINEGSISAKKKSNRDDIELELEDWEFMDFNPSAVVLDELLEVEKKCSFLFKTTKKNYDQKFCWFGLILLKTRGKCMC